ncbi:MAG: bifunctional 4-hydroxy-2-oxoglutarate aldolase/2-dehydro-3-deoxy-phosphogluconate aldolase [Anaerolineales bacterium]
MNEVVMKLGEYGVVPVIAIPSADDAPALGQALLEGGLPCAEITFRTAAAQESIRELSRTHPEILVGAGTVLSKEQAERAAEAGARFIVSPGYDANVVTWCLDNNIAVTPGVATPTEINMALDRGLQVLKFFPSEALGGIRTIKAIAGPYREVKFIPTGGINPKNLADYLRLPAVHCCGGSWLAKRGLIADGEFAQISRLVREAVDIVHSTRAEGSP